MSTEFKDCPFCKRSGAYLGRDTKVWCQYCKANAPEALWNRAWSDEPHIPSPKAYSLPANPSSVVSLMAASIGHLTDALAHEHSYSLTPSQAAHWAIRQAKELLEQAEGLMGPLGDDPPSGSPPHWADKGVPDV